MGRRAVYKLELIPKTLVSIEIPDSKLEVYNGKDYVVLEKRPRDFQKFLNNYFLEESDLIRRLIAQTALNPELKVQGIIYDNRKIEVIADS